jgi:hypothetical protein
LIHLIIHLVSVATSGLLQQELAARPILEASGREAATA